MNISGSVAGSKPNLAGEPMAVFGVAVSVAAERMPSHDGIPLPVVFRECIDQVEERGLQFEGIYRVSGFKSKIDALIASYNRHESPDLRAQGPHIAAALLKQFLRQLPSSLFTQKLQKSFEDAAAISDQQKREATLAELLDKIPKTNKLCLSWLIVHLVHVLENSAHNKVTQEQLVTVMSTSMQMSHRILKALINSAGILFKDAKIVPYQRPDEKGDDDQAVKILSAAVDSLSVVDSRIKAQDPEDIAASGEHAYCEPKEVSQPPAKETEKQMAEEMDPEMLEAVERLRNYIERRYITEEQKNADPELKTAILEERLLIIQQEEELELCDDLKRKCEAQRDEIEHLRSKIRMERNKHILAGVYKETEARRINSDGSFPEDSVALQNMLSDLKKANAKKDAEIADLINEIHVHREACLDIRVEMRQLQNLDLHDIQIPTMADNRAHPDFENMF